MAVRGQIKCIYCKEFRPTPARGEHIILAGLGGTATIKDVCSGCNSFLGRSIDEEFLRKSDVAYRRFLDPEITDGEIGSVQFGKIECGYLDGRLSNSGIFECLPQLFLEGDGVHAVAQTAKDATILEQVALDVKNSGLQAIHLDVRDVEEHRPARLVANRRNKKHLLRATCQGDVEKLVQLVQKGERREGGGKLALSRDMNLRWSMDVNVPGRCVAKMAFNAAAYVFGPEILVDGSFDAVRNYILGHDVKEGPVTLADGEVALRLDDRFVDDMLEGQDRASRGHPTYHEIILAAKDGNLCGNVNLFGHAKRYWVRLGPLPPDGLQRLPIALLKFEEGDAWHLIKLGQIWFHHQQPKWAL